jgi:hypothetical protein
MRVCGIEIKGSDAIVLIIEGISKDFKLVKSDLRKISVDDSDNPEDIAKFYDDFFKFLKEHNVDFIGVKKRNTKGRFAGGASSFKIEGLIQLASAKTTLIPPQTILKYKKDSPKYPDSLLKYQLGAFETAFALISMKE